MLTGLRLLAVAGLGAAYLWVASVAARPRVDAEYAAHFLGRTADCWLPRASRSRGAPPPASVEIGRLDRAEACRYLRLNWRLVEGRGAWAEAGHATLRLPWRSGASAVELTFQGAPAPGPSTRVRFVLNGQATAEEIPPGASKAVVFPLPSDGERHDPDMRLGFGDRAVVPGPSPKQVAYGAGIGLVAIRYLPVPPDAGADAAAPAPDAAADADAPGREARSPASR